MRKDEPKPCPVEHPKYRCTRGAGHEGYHWHEDSNSVAVFGTSDQPLTWKSFGLENP